MYAVHSSFVIWLDGVCTLHTLRQYFPWSTHTHTYTHAHMFVFTEPLQWRTANAIKNQRKVELCYWNSFGGKHSLVGHATAEQIVNCNHANKYKSKQFPAEHGQWYRLWSTLRASVTIMSEVGCVCRHSHEHTMVRGMTNIGCHMGSACLYAKFTNRSNCSCFFCICLRLNRSVQRKRKTYFPI